MTLEEKIGQLSQYAGGALTGPDAQNTANTMHLAETGGLGSVFNTDSAELIHEFQRAAVEKSRLHIPVLIGYDIIHGYRTIYPVPLGMAASFDPDLVTKMTHLAAQEATADGIRWVFSPMADIARDARWGRSTESAGEDSYLDSAMAAAQVRGYQGSSLSNSDSVAACVKHFAAYGAAEAGRDYNTTDMSDITLRQIYLPPYHAAVQAGAATVMTSFNALNGTPATANPYLLQNILRDEWKFHGFVVSDWQAIMELTHHGIALDAATASRKAILSGVDMDMMAHYYDTTLAPMVRSGAIPLSVIDEATRRVLRVKFALGLFEHPYADEERHAPESPSIAGRALARTTAEESFVLLKNDAGPSTAPLLPLPSGRTIALIGPLADAQKEMLGAWGMSGHAADVITLKSALATAGAKLLYAKGTEVLSDSEAGFPEAVRAAKRADIVILALGESANMSGEAASRSNLDLPGNQEQLLEAVAATGKPIVLLVFSGRPLVLNWAAKHIPAIMEVWFPGVEAGPALAEVLFGRVSPSGKLPMSFPRAVGQEPLYYNQLPTGRPTTDIDLTHPPANDDEKYHSRYIDVENSALFPFGHGLTYTQFTYGDVSVDRNTLPLATALAGQDKPVRLLTFRVLVTNTGTRTGTEVVQLYLRNTGSSIEQPIRSLKGFQRVTLQPGESKLVTFDAGFDALSFYNAQSKLTIEAAEYTAWVGGSSEATHNIKFEVAP